MKDQPALFDVTPTHRVLTDDEVYYPDYLIVARQLCDYPCCPVCDGQVFTAGAMIGNLPGGRGTRVRHGSRRGP